MVVSTGQCNTTAEYNKWGRQNSLSQRMRAPIEHACYYRASTFRLKKWRFSERRGSLTQKSSEIRHFSHDGSRRVPRPWEFSSGSSFIFLQNRFWERSFFDNLLPNWGVVLEKKAVHLYRSKHQRGIKLDSRPTAATWIFAISHSLFLFVFVRRSCCCCVPGFNEHEDMTSWVKSSWSTTCWKKKTYEMSEVEDVWNTFLEPSEIRTLGFDTLSI